MSCDWNCVNWKCDLQNGINTPLEAARNPQKKKTVTSVRNFGISVEEPPEGVYAVAVDMVFPEQWMEIECRCVSAKMQFFGKHSCLLGGIFFIRF